ncbi:MAG TPA: ChbG/HpnK family deacetylase [Candidatus Limnocylindria bacterium]|nr:ChbG/HpnK family deacetylase [Candidatus Limnocylindria bacterium]
MSVIVTADDLGLSAGVTRGILEAHRRGVVRSTSLLVTFPAAQEAAALALAEPDLEVGLHLDLVGGRPASDPAAVRSLCDGDGRFYPLPAFTRRLLTGRVRPAELAAELRAQTARARSWGVSALAWDSHRHVHLMPPVALVVGHVARELGVRWVRRARGPRLRAQLKTASLHAASLVSELAFRGIRGPSWYVDLTSHRPRLDGAGVALLAAYGGLGELSAHPGYVDDDLRDRDALVHERADDLALLTDPLLRTALGGDGVIWRVH